MDYRGKPVDSPAQLESVLFELVVSDLEKIEKRLDKIAQERKRGLKVSEAEAAVLEKCKKHLEAEQPLRTATFTADEEKSLRTYPVPVAEARHGHRERRREQARRLRAGAAERRSRPSTSWTS